MFHTVSPENRSCVHNSTKYVCVCLVSTWCHMVGLDWIVQCFTSPPTQYRLYGGRFLQVKRPKQQYQSIEALKERFISLQKLTQLWNGIPVAGNYMDQFWWYWQKFSKDSRVQFACFSFHVGLLVITLSSLKLTHSLTAARNRLWVIAPSMLTGRRWQSMHQQQWVRCPALSG